MNSVRSWDITEHSCSCKALDCKQQVLSFGQGQLKCKHPYASMLLHRKHTMLLLDVYAVIVFDVNQF